MESHGKVMEFHFRGFVGTLSWNSCSIVILGEPPRRPFSSLMKKVVFVMSGYQNPERGQIRDEAIEMGATYKPDWGKECTHLM